MTPTDINQLLFSPIFAGKLLHHFILGACNSHSQNIKFELIYLALPFLYDEIITKKLQSSNSTSTLSTLLSSTEIKNQVALKSYKIDEFKDITNKGLIYLSKYSDITITTHITTKNEVDYKKEKHGDVKSLLKAAYYWGLILAKEDYKNIYVKLEIFHP